MMLRKVSFTVSVFHTEHQAGYSGRPALFCALQKHGPQMTRHLSKFCTSDDSLSNFGTYRINRLKLYSALKAIQIFECEVHDPILFIAKQCIKALFAGKVLKVENNINVAKEVQMVA